MKVTLSTGEARVYVRYGHDKRQRRTTEVEIQQGTDPITVWKGHATCSKKDVFHRSEGRKIALAHAIAVGARDFSKADRVKLWGAIAPHVFRQGQLRLTDGR